VEGLDSFDQGPLQGRDRLAGLRDLQGRVARLGELAEQLPHLLGRLDVELLGVELQAVRVGQDLAGLLDAQKHIVGSGLAALRVVGVVGGHQRDAQVPGQADQERVDRSLLGETVLLQLDIEGPRAEQVPERCRRLPGLGFLTGHQHPADLAGQAPREADQPLRPLGEQLPVDARPVVEALQVGVGDQPEEVPVARLVADKDGQMPVVLVVLTGGPIET
jgi:hypothetical protein